MTEDEAKTKWCPFSRIVAKIGDGEHVVNRSSGDKDMHTLCIGSACMAWRPTPFAATADKIIAIKEHRRVHGSDLLTAKNAVEAAWNPMPAGFCGLAGAPQ